MKYVILIHSNPQPWGHPTRDYLPEHLQETHESPEAREEAGRRFEQSLQDLFASGELLVCEALGDPATARLFRWDGAPVVTDGPYSETKEHLAGFFLIDVDSLSRAEEISAMFGGPGETVELRPSMWPGGDDQ